MPRWNSQWTPENLEKLSTYLSNGLTQHECGVLFGVKRQRIEQIIKKHNLFSHRSEFGAYKKALKRKEELATKHKDRWFISKEIKQEALSNKDSFLAKCYKKFKGKKYNCFRLGVDFDIQFDDLEFPTHCPILNIELDYDLGLCGIDNIPTFDRIDSTKGYIKNNVHIISNRANRIKNDSTLAELKALVKYLEDMEKTFDKNT